MAQLERELMENEFIVTITTGNETMRTNLDLADALEKVAKRIRHSEWSGHVRDINGNKVGTFG